LAATYRCLFIARIPALLIIDSGLGGKKASARETWNTYARKIDYRFEREGLAVLQSASPERSSMTHRDARVIESLPGAGVPALVIVGADDKPFLAAAEYMAAKIRATRLVVIPAAGHAVNIDQPQAFLDAVLPFFNGLESRKKQKAVL
jgi:pimeloyl-ACP methyl ester carboxylesterase